MFQNFDGDTYKGEWVDDKPNGFGKYYDKSGSIYEGGFLNGEKSG